VGKGSLQDGPFLLPEYLVVVLLLGAAQALVFPHLSFSIRPGGDILLALWSAVYVSRIY
jgi:hypothetical protein